MLRLSGWLLEDGKFQEGSLEIEGEVISHVSHRKAPDAIATGLILPAFANAHTHAGDAVVRADLVGTLEELVGPPRGLKHRALEASSDEDAIAAMRAYFGSMLRTGTVAFTDFREMGLRGTRQLYAAALGLPLRPTVFGRPAGLSYDGDEVRALLRACDGIAISSLLDWDHSEAAKLAREAHAAGKAFALHASERVREDIDDILDLKPDLIVHLTEATDADLGRVADEDIPVAVCPRSNAFFGKVLDLPGMVRAGLDLRLGTDNAMVNDPSMLRELDFTWKLSRLRGGINPATLLRMAFGGTASAGRMGAGLEPGGPADVIVLDVPDGRPTFGGIFRGVETDIALVAAGGRSWVRTHSELVESAARGPKGRRVKATGRSSPPRWRLKRR